MCRPYLVPVIDNVGSEKSSYLPVYMRIILLIRLFERES